MAVLTCEQIRREWSLRFSREELPDIEPLNGSQFSKFEAIRTERDLNAADRDGSFLKLRFVAYDREFYEFLPRLYPHADARGWFTSNAALAAETAFRNSSLQGAYLILALRGQGLDCGPMSGFDNAKLDAAFFPDGRWRSNFLLNIGYGEHPHPHPRLPRLDFAEIARWA